MATEYFVLEYQETVKARSRSNLPARTYWAVHCECDFLSEVQEVARDLFSDQPYRIVRRTEQIIEEAT